MPQPARPTVQPAVSVKAPPAPARLSVGLRSILNHLQDTAANTSAAQSQLTAEHQKHLDKIASLAQQLRAEIDALAKLEPPAPK